MPRAGSKGALALQLLEEGPMASADLADALEVDSQVVGATLATVLKHGLIVKRLENNRAIYSLATDDDGQPVRRVVDTPSVQPTAAAVASAQPFSRAAFPQLTSSPDVEIPRFVPQNAPPRFGVFSDGTLVIEAGMARIDLDAAMAKRLLELARAVAA